MMDDDTEDICRFRCGIPGGAQLEFFGDAAAAKAFGHACEALSQAGADIVEVDFGPFAEVARLLYEGPWVAERYAALKDFMREHAGDMNPVTREVIATAGRWSAVDAFEAFYRLGELKRRCEREWAKMDVLAVPSAGTIYTLEQIAAAPVERNTRLGYYTNFVNLMDLAALAVPGAFRTDGLPAGITLIAPADHDRLLATLGAHVHRAGGVRLGATGFALPAACGARATRRRAARWCWRWSARISRGCRSIISLLRATRVCWKPRRPLHIIASMRFPEPGLNGRGWCG